MEKEQKEKMLADITNQEERIERLFIAACQVISARVGAFMSCDVEIYRAAQRILECRAAFEDFAKTRFMLDLEKVD